MISKKNTILLFVVFVLIAIILPSIAVVRADPTPTVSFDPSSFNATQLNQTFTLDVTISNVQHLWGWSANVTWDSDYIALKGKPTEGNFLSDQVSTMFAVQTPGESIGFGLSIPSNMVTISDASSDSYDGQVAGSGVLATLTFQVIKPCSQAPVTLSGLSLIYGRSSDQINTYITPSSATSTATVTLAPISGPPIADAGKNQTVVQGSPVFLNASKTISTGTDATYSWTFTDGTPQTLTGQVANYTFVNPGTYNILLTVQDSLGNGTATTTVTVQSPAPTEAPSPTIDYQGPSSTPSTNPNNNAESSALPPTVLGILIAITILVLLGSVFWLRKR